MQGQYRLISGSRVKEKTRDRLAGFFVGGVTARAEADWAASTARRVSLFLSSAASDHQPGNWEPVDGSYFGGVRKGERGRGAAGKIPVFGILKRGGKVHTMMIPDVRKNTLLPIIRHKVVPDSRLSIAIGIPPMTFSTSPGSHHHRIGHSDAYVLDRTVLE